MSLNLTIQGEALAELMKLPKDVQDEVRVWAEALNSVGRPVKDGLVLVAARFGVSLTTARRKYDAWRKTQDWRVLINKVKCPEVRGLDPEFVSWWSALCKQNARKCRPAYKDFCRRWASGELIPGMPAGLSRHRLPHGYSYDNLMRHAPSTFELVNVRIGRGAAADYRPKVFTTRQGLRVGQFLVFDDMWHDFKVVAVGQRKAARLLQLHAHDIASGCQFARGLKPRLEDLETGKSVGLKEDEMLFLLCAVLGDYGYLEDGCTLMVEHGTAAIREDIERDLFDLTGGKILVDRSGIEGASAFAGQFAGRGKGNFRFKASLESLGNLIHNETANMLVFPGQTGSNSRLNAPEELHGRERHADQLALAIAALPSTVREKLRMPFLEVNEAIWLVEEVMERINRRTDHELEGWIECGNTVVDLYLDNVGIITREKFVSLPIAQRMAVEAVAEPVPRKLSPREVFEAGRGQLKRFQPAQIAKLLSSRQGYEVAVGNDHLITFEDVQVSPEPLRYLAHHFAPGTGFRAVVNPWSPSSLHLFNARGGWVGTVDSWQRIRRDDSHAIERQMGAAAKTERELLQPLVDEGRALTRKRLEDAQHNIGVIRGMTAATPEEKRAERALDKEARDRGQGAADALLSEPTRDKRRASAADDFLSSLSEAD